MNADSDLKARRIESLNADCTIMRRRTLSMVHGAFIRDI